MGERPPHPPEYVGGGAGAVSAGGEASDVSCEWPPGRPLQSQGVPEPMHAGKQKRPGPLHGHPGAYAFAGSFEGRRQYGWARDQRSAKARRAAALGYSPHPSAGSPV